MFLKQMTELDLGYRLDVQLWAFRFLSQCLEERQLYLHPVIFENRRVLLVLCVSGTLLAL
jgi:hypothetical protein